MSFQMDFLDEVVITVRSGDGGRGCISFRREKYIPRGGPDGGNGGEGGSILIRASGKLHSLTDYAARRYFKAPNGHPGRGKDQTGKKGEDLLLEVPLGTLIQDQETGKILSDLIDEGETFLLVSGGIGGKGNKHFTTSTNRAPRIAQPGLPGHEKKITLLLKFIADIGLVGLPNAGKSTLLSRLTNARPKIDGYPFTTLVPNLGTLDLLDGKSITLADIPGLIEGASMGRGLGHQFLKHIDRTRLLFHILDITFEPKGPDILEDFNLLNREMGLFNRSLMDKKQLVLINKMDLDSPGHRDLSRVRESLTEMGFKTFPISALRGDGLEDLMEFVSTMWESLPHSGSGKERPS
jgi:GTP-binding protein